MVDASLSLNDIDELLYTCSTHWGGGYWPIIPSDGNTIAPDWWKVLEAVDPDIVIHCLPLSAVLEDRIHRHLAPAKVVHTPHRDGDVRYFGLHEVNALDSYDTLAYRSARVGIRDAKFMAIEDSREATPDRAFALRNFGLVRSSIQTKSAFRSVEVETRKVRDLSKGGLLTWWLDSFSEVIVPRDLGMLSAPRPFDNEHGHPFSGFTLIVGDSIDEILFAWNKALLSSGHLGRDVLWIDSISARDADFLALVAKWIQRCFWNNQQQQKGSVLSYTEDRGFLEELAKNLRTPTSMYWESVRLDVGHFPTRIRAPWGWQYRDQWESPPRTVEHIPMTARGDWDTPSGLFTVPRPPFLGSRTGQAEWMIDLDIEYTLDPQRYSNVADRWRLPRVARLGRLFATGRELCRIQHQHEPSISVRAADQTIGLQIPSKAALLRALFEPLPLSSRPIDMHSGHPRSKYQDVRISEQGRRFRGLVDLLGGVGSAGRVFNDDFWRTVLLEAVGKPSDDTARLAHTLKRELTPLFDAFAELPSAEGVEMRLQQLGLDAALRRLAGALHRLRAQPRTFTRAELEARHGQLTTEMIQDEKGLRKLRFSEDAEHTFEWLLETGALLQGVLVVCPQCGTKQWRGVDDLARVLHCRDCTADFPLPSDPSWEYQVNGLIRNAIIRHGVLPVVHASWKLTDRARVMAIVIAPQELREEEDGPLVTDLDIIIVVDGEFILGEVKSSPDSFDEQQMSILASVAQELRPNVFVLAAPGKEWPPEVNARFEDFEEKLTSFDVKVKRLLLDW